MSAPRKLPCDQCRGKCCTYPTFLNSEYKRVRDRHGIPAGTISRNLGFARVLYRAGGDCPYLKDGACSIYQDRPKVCRDYGVVEALPCQFLYPDEALAEAAKRWGAA